MLTEAERPPIEETTPVRISRYELSKLILATVTFSIALSTTHIVFSAEKKSAPNIVFILADDMGFGDVTALNAASRIPTPNLDKLARESLVFTDAHAAGSYCVPSRYGLLTGRYMWRTRLGSGGNLANFAGTLIEPGRKTIADLLQAVGYQTALVGKWHQGIDWKLHDESAREQIRVDPNYQDFKNIDFASPALKGPNGLAGTITLSPPVTPWIASCRPFPTKPADSSRPPSALNRINHFSCITR